MWRLQSQASFSCLSSVCVSVCLWEWERVYVYWFIKLTIPLFFQNLKVKGPKDSKDCTTTVSLEGKFVYCCVFVCVYMLSCMYIYMSVHVCVSQLGWCFKTPVLPFLLVYAVAGFGRQVGVWVIVRAHTHTHTCTLCFRLSRSLSLSVRLCWRKEALNRRTEWGEEKRDMEVLLVLRLCCNCTYGNDCMMCAAAVWFRQLGVLFHRFRVIFIWAQMCMSLIRWYIVSIMCLL